MKSNSNELPISVPLSFFVENIPDLEDNSLKAWLFFYFKHFIGN